MCVGYVGSLFAEAYYFSWHAFRIFCIARGACPEDLSILVHKHLYVRALVALAVQSFSIYIDVFLMIAVGVFSDRKEFLIRDLDEYGVKRSKGFAIYDITKTSKPYYSSLRENAATDEKSLRDQYLLVKEGEDQAQPAREPQRLPLNSVAPEPEPSIAKRE